MKLETFNSVDSQDTPEQIAKKLDQQRPVLDKILGRKKTDPVEIAHDMAFVEDRLRKQKAIIEAAHTDALYENWSRRFEGRCVLSFSSHDGVHPSVVFEEVVSGTIDGKSFNIKKTVLDEFHPLDEITTTGSDALPEAYTGQLDGVPFSEEQAEAIWNNILPLALEQHVSDVKEKPNLKEPVMSSMETEDLIDSLAKLG